MSACKQYQRRLALLSARPLEESETSDVLAHLNLCSECRAYSQRLQVVVDLCRKDAERSIFPMSRPLPARSLPKRQRVAWPRAAALATAAVVLGAAFFLRREPLSPPPDPHPPVASQSGPVSVVSIGDSRRFLNQNLDTLPEPLERYQRSDFVFSVATRHEGL